MKDWILRYAEQSSDEEEEEEEEGGKKAHNPELDEKFDPVMEIILIRFVKVKIRSTLYVCGGFVVMLCLISCFTERPLFDPHCSAV